MSDILYTFPSLRLIWLFEACSSTDPCDTMRIVADIRLINEGFTKEYSAMRIVSNRRKVRPHDAFKATGMLTLSHSQALWSLQEPNKRFSMFWAFDGDPRIYDDPDHCASTE